MTACGLGASLAVAAGALGPRHRVAQAAVGLLLGAAFVLAGVLLLSVAFVGGFGGGK